MVLRTIVDLCGSRRNLVLSSPDLERLQIKKLKTLLTFAYDNVPFYHTRLKDVGIRPDDVKTIDDLDKIPFTTKEDIQSTPQNQMVAQNVGINRCVTNRTSGSTGLPLITLASRRSNSLDAVMWRRANFENGMRLRDKIIEIRDPRNFHRKRWLEHFGILRTEYVSIFDDVKRQAAFLTREEPDVIESYPSSMEILADFFAHQKVHLKPRLIFTLAEFLDRASRESITKTFETELFDYYGSSEIGLISWECKEHGAYHINADNLIIQFIDSNGETVSTGESGEIVCTGLNNYAMPLIRYQQGDIGAGVDGECLCGIRMPLMQIIGGRKDDFLMATDGRVIPPTIFYPYPFENLEKIRKFRVIQEKRDKLEIQLVVREGFNPQLLEGARKNVQRLFGEDMQVEFEFLEEIGRDPNGKLRKIISRLPRAQELD
jgi:phenylacetate-CoA ligase